MCVFSENKMKKGKDANIKLNVMAEDWLEFDSVFDLSYRFAYLWVLLGQISI